MSDSISISILNLDFKNLNSDLTNLKENKVTQIHIDVIDTSFTNNISFGPSIINTILQYDFKFSIHFMISNPFQILDSLDLKKIDSVIFHYEMENFKNEFDKLQKYKFKKGVAIDTKTEVENLGYLECDFILVMLVNAGFGGQDLILKCVEKVDKFQKLGYEVWVDGGVNEKNINVVKNADVIVVGSAYFKSDDKKAFLDDVYQKIKRQF